MQHRLRRDFDALEPRWLPLGARAGREPGRGGAAGRGASTVGKSMGSAARQRQPLCPEEGGPRRAQTAGPDGAVPGMKGTVTRPRDIASGLRAVAGGRGAAARAAPGATSSDSRSLPRVSRRSSTPRWGVSSRTSSGSLPLSPGRRRSSWRRRPGGSGWSCPRQLFGLGGGNDSRNPGSAER